jgi:hypothetical protein
MSHRLFSQWFYMELLGNVKVNANGLVDVAALGVSKAITERALSPYIGNATVKSGALKLVGGALGYSFLGSNFIGKAVAGGLIVDGIEDVTVSLLGMSGTQVAAQGEVW